MHIIKSTPPGGTAIAAAKTSFLCFSQNIPIGNASGIFKLQYGHSLTAAALAINDYQPARPTKPKTKAPVYLVLGGISAHRWLFDHCMSNQQTKAKPGWWSNIVGPGKALDPTATRLIGVDFLGSGASSKPGFANEFIVTPNDQAHAIAQALSVMGIQKLDGVIGCSYGGNVALALASLYPKLITKALVLCAADRPAVITSAYRSIQRRIVQTAITNDDIDTGLQTARQLAMLGFRTAEELQQRFQGKPVVTQQALLLPVENYLQARGTSWAQNTNAAEFICLSQSCDLASVEATKINIPLWLAAAYNDAIVPFEDVQRLAHQAPKCQRVIELHTNVGHDAFLTETVQINSLVGEFLNDGKHNSHRHFQGAVA